MGVHCCAYMQTCLVLQDRNTHASALPLPHHPCPPPPPPTPAHAHPPHPSLPPQLARLPSMHTLPVRNPEVLEAWAFGDLEEINLHFVLMVERTVREDTDIAVHEVEAPRPKTPWRLPESIFKPRLKEADSKGFFDTHQVRG